ncbi:hypothetical protein N7492_001003, partial [Penicillium capsulatum]
DYFRKNADHPPLACFLSHVHSDHLQGLESFRAPFIYCSPATRELLLRIEKYPHRMNFHRGTLESRRLHYKHLGKLLRPIPLNTPTEIELTPRCHVRVTLFNANHCIGAVAFLIEGAGKAILYTGDIRAESWWINSLVRHPVLIPYTFGQRRLDKIYLDTTFAWATNPFRTFPSKAQGIAELLQKVDTYPEGTIFYFRAWTFGYEEVWQALATALNTKVHVDRYQMGLYRSLANTSISQGISEAPALCGFGLGNRVVAGCLSNDESSRIHSCEPGLLCPAAHGPNTVYVTPIVNRTNDGAEIPEVGAGGGLGDLYQVHELELPDESSLVDLQKLCLQNIQDPQLLSQIQNALVEAFQSKRQALPLDRYGVQEEGTISLESLVTKLSQGVSKESSVVSTDLPSTIRFPFSRHSSYAELCELVAAFRPKDVHPCTVDPTSWNEGVSIGRLFGHLCSSNDFSHDTYMRVTLKDAHYESQQARKRARYDQNASTQSTESSNIDACDISLSETDRNEFCGSMQPANGPPGQDPGTQHPSSLRALFPAIQEPRHPASQSPGISRDPDRTTAKRSEVRRAHRYLREHAKPDELGIGPLPSSWPAEEEHNLESKLGLDSRTSTSDHYTSSTRQGCFAVGDDPASPQPHPSQPASQLQDSQHTDSLTLSISESALAPDSFGSRAESAGRDSKQETMTPRPAAKDRLMARMRARTAAYLAAQEDSYSAWADVSPVSAGNTHTEPEEEL